MDAKAWKYLGFAILGWTLFDAFRRFGQWLLTGTWMEIMFWAFAAVAAVCSAVALVYLVYHLLGGEPDWFGTGDSEEEEADA